MNSLSAPRPPSSLGIVEFLSSEASGGIALVLAAAVALIWANSPGAALYKAILDLPILIQAGDAALGKPLLLWVNDGLMAVFFLLVGLEIKREIFAGELAGRDKVLLPSLAAIGGMIAPALLYVAINFASPLTMRGWAIPCATDIAFALGVAAVLGDRVPQPLKILLMALAIIDDLGAIIIIALFYTSNLSIIALELAGCAILVLFVLNRVRVASLTPYVLVGIFLWTCVLKSGVHATLAGVALAFAIPIHEQEDTSPLHRLERVLHTWVSYGILPLFAFANAGIPLNGVTLGMLLGAASARGGVRSSPRQAARRHGGGLHGSALQDRRFARGRELAAVFRHVAVDGDRFHDEPVHRDPGVRQRWLSDGTADRRTHRIAIVCDPWIYRAAASRLARSYLIRTAGGTGSLPAGRRSVFARLTLGRRLSSTVVRRGSEPPPAVASSFSSFLATLRAVALGTLKAIIRFTHQKPPSGRGAPSPFPECDLMRAGRRRGQYPLALEPLAHRFAVAANRLGPFAGATLRRLLIGATALHLAKGAFALHLFLQDAEGAIDVVIANIDLHGRRYLSWLSGDASG